MKPINVLIGFEESGTLRDAFRDAGFNAYSCDLKPSRYKSDYHLKMDILEAFKHLDLEWQLIILHPECTALTVAGNHVYAKGKPKHKARLKAIKYTAKIWHTALTYCDRICLENPQGVLHTNTNLPKPQYIQPYEYGDNASKKTGLTLCGLPNLIGTKRIRGRFIEGVERWNNQTDTGQNRLPPSPTRARDRSVTYKGIADAMVAQWGSVLIEKK